MSARVTTPNAHSDRHSFEQQQVAKPSPKGEWKTQLASKAQTLALWRLIQQIFPDDETLKIKGHVEHLPGYERGSMDLAQRLRHWQVATGLNTDELFAIVGNTTFTVVSDSPSMPHPQLQLLNHLMALPLHELNKGASLISTAVSQALPKDQVDGAKHAMAVCTQIDQAITVVDLGLAIAEVWTLDKQITLLKKTLLPVDEAQCEELEAEMLQLKAELSLADEKKVFALDSHRLATLMQMMLLQVRLHPSSNLNFRAAIQEAIDTMEKRKKSSVDNAKGAAIVLGVDVVIFVLTVGDPTGLASKLFGLALKVKSATPVLKGFQTAWKNVKDGIAQKGLADRTFKVLSSKAFSPEEQQLLKTAQKVKSVYWGKKNLVLFEGASIKTLSTAGVALGITLLILKILAIVGVVAVGAAALAGMGYGVLAIAGAVLIIKLITAIYRNRHWIGAQIQKINLAVRHAFNKIGETLGVDRSDSVCNLRLRMHRLDKHISNWKSAQKTAGISHRLLRELSKNQRALNDKDALSVYKAQQLVKSITGREGSHLKDLEDKGAIADQEICDRTLASILDQIS